MKKLKNPPHFAGLMIHNEGMYRSIDRYELILQGDCKKEVEEIMKNLGPYGQKYLKRRLFFEKDAETLQSSDLK